MAIFLEILGTYGESRNDMSFWLTKQETLIMIII